MDQPAESFALWESYYPLMNQWGLALGESTTSGKEVLGNAEAKHLDPKTNDTKEGQALFTISGLMALALEQCRSAVCAIKTMGTYAQEYGFAGEEYASPEGVTVVDPTQAWVFEIHGDGSGKGAIWVAQKVPEGHVAIIPNSAIIKEVNTSRPDEFIWSDNLHEVAQKFGFWNASSGRLLNWQEDLMMPHEMPRYSTLRTWRLFSKLAPSAKVKGRLMCIPCITYLVTSC